MSLTGDNFYDAVSRAVSLGGPTALALRAVLSVISKGLSGGFGLLGGSEMRASARAADEVGAQVILGINPTFSLEFHKGMKMVEDLVHEQRI